MSQNDINMEIIERLSRMEEKVDTLIRSRRCDLQDARLTAVERKLWISMGGLTVIGAIVGWLSKNMSALQMLIGGSP